MEMPINFDDLSAEDLREVKKMPKHLQKALPEKEQRGSICVDYELVAGAYKFILYTRQNTQDPANYSVGIRAVGLRGSKKTLTLSRYNGSDHVHGEFHRQSHVHHITVESQHWRKPESGDAIGGDYSDMNGALAQLIKEYNVSGIPIQEKLL